MKKMTRQILLGITLIVACVSTYQASQDDTVQATVDRATNEFSLQAHPGDPNYLVVVLPRNPDPARERYSGDPANPFASKSSAETTAYLLTQRDASIQQLLDNSVDLRAVLITNLWGRLGRQPTTQEIAAEFARFVTVRRGLK